MKIKKDTPMMVFRFSDFRVYDFISLHEEVLNVNGFVWMLKAGRWHNADKIRTLIEFGGWMILKAPKGKGGKYYLTHFTEAETEAPNDKYYPSYYKEFLNENGEDGIWIKIDKITEMRMDDVQKFVVTKSGRNMIEVINSTMTAAMFIHNVEDIVI